MKTLEEYRLLINASLEQQLDSLGKIPEVLRNAMWYSLEAGGKRLRPAMLLAAAELAGADIQKAMPYACALEMIHTYSLIHDDLPAMDNDDLRRGRPTNHKVFGEGMAILAGDGLLHAAMQLLMKAAVQLGTVNAFKAAECIAHRSGITGMVAGQTVDVTEEGTTPTIERVEYIHCHKTADLLIAPIEAGLLLGNAADDELEAGRMFGYHFGLAFQIQDDLLDVCGDEALMGKQTGLDIQAGKLTWVAVRGIENARKDAAEHVGQAMNSAEKLEGNKGFFYSLAKDSLMRDQ